LVGNYNEVINFIVHEHGFVYNGSTFTKLDVPGAIDTEPDGIDGSTVVGTWYGSGGANRGFIYDGHTLKTLTCRAGT
jgi:hypothetical protein